MAAQTQSAANKLEMAVLGRAATREDWTKDVWLRLGLIFLGPSQSNLTKLLVERLRLRAGFARPALDEIIGSLDGRPEGFLTELKKLRNMIVTCSTSDLYDSSSTSESLFGLIEVEAEILIAEQKAIANEWQDFLDRLDDVDESVMNIPRAMRTIGREFGQNRTAAVRDVQNLFTTLFATQPNVPPVVSLSYAWASLQGYEPSEEVFAALAAGSGNFAATLSSQLCCRLLAHLYQKDGQLLRANDWSKRSFEYRQSAEANIDCALIASELHEPSSSRNYVEAALLERPGSIIALLADERSVGLGNDLLEVIVRVQMRLRRDGRQFVQNWAAEVKDVQEIQRTIGAELPISFELMEGYKKAEIQLSEADLISAGTLVRYCELSRTSLQKETLFALQKEFDNRREALTQARLAMDSISVAREDKIRAARQENGVRLRNAHAQVAGMAEQGKGREKLSIIWFCSGCALFGLYLITKVVLNSSGSTVDIPTDVGIFLLIVAAIPILLSVGIQVHHGLKRATVESTVREKVSEANKLLNQAELEANDFHREQLAIGRKNLTEAENRLRKVELVLRTNIHDSSEKERVSARLRAA